MKYPLRLLHALSMIIGVNDAALYLKTDAALSMDRLWLEGRQQLLQMVGPAEVWYRHGTPKNFKPPDYWTPYTHANPEPATMSTEVNHLYGSNSGTCAINLAVQQVLLSKSDNSSRKRRIFLFGFDMQPGEGGEKHWYPDYPWNNGGGTKKATLREWADEFKSIAAQCVMMGIEVYNVNHRSLITAFPVISFDECLEKLRDVF